MKNKITVTFIGRYLTLVFNFIILYIISKFYGPKVKGNHTLLLTTVSFFQFIIGFWGSNGLIFLISKSKNQHWSTLLLFVSIFFSLSSFFVLYYFTELMKMFAFTISIGLILNSILSIHQTDRLLNSEFKLYNLFYSLPAFFCCLILICDVFIFKFYTINSVQYSWLISLLLVVILSMFFSNHKMVLNSNFRFWEEVKISFSQNAPFQMIEFLQFLLLRLPLYFLVFLHGVEYMGIYSVGLSVLESTWHIARSIGLVVFVNSVNDDKNQSNLTESSLFLLFTTTTITAILVVFLFFIPANWYAIVFGSKFIHTPYTIRYLYPGIIAYSSIIIMENYFLSLKKLKMLQLVYLLVLIVNIALTVILIPNWQFSAVAFTSSVTYILVACILFYFFYKEIKNLN